MSKHVITITDLDDGITTIEATEDVSGDAVTVADTFLQAMLQAAKQFDIVVVHEITEENT